MVKEFYGEAMEHVQGSPFGRFRAIEWKDVVDLEALFKSENLVTHGEFFDQRFVDYLHRNFGDITKIHWRQFERLTAEYFATTVPTTVAEGRAGLPWDAGYTRSRGLAGQAR